MRSCENDDDDTQKQKEGLADNAQASSAVVAKNAASSSSLSSSWPLPLRFSSSPLDDGVHHRSLLSVSPLPSVGDSSTSADSTSPGFSPRLPIADTLAAAAASPGGKSFLSADGGEVWAGATSGGGGGGGGDGGGGGGGAVGGGGGMGMAGTAVVAGAAVGVGGKCGGIGATTPFSWAGNNQNCRSDREQNGTIAAEWWREAREPSSTQQRPVTRRSLVGGSSRSAACLSWRGGDTRGGPSTSRAGRGGAGLAVAPMCGFSTESKQRRLEGCLKRRCGAPLNSFFFPDSLIAF